MNDDLAMANDVNYGSSERLRKGSNLLVINVIVLNYVHVTSLQNLDVLSTLKSHGSDWINLKIVSNYSDNDIPNHLIKLFKQ